MARPAGFEPANPGLGNGDPASEGRTEQELTAADSAVTADTTALPCSGKGDADLQSFVAAWPRIPSHVRAGILAMVDAVLPDDSSR